MGMRLVHWTVLALASVGCAGSAWRPGPSSPTVLAVRGPEEWAVGAAVVRPDGELAGSWLRERDLDLPLFATGWARPGPHRLVVATMAPGVVPRHVELPLPLTGREDFVLVDIIDWGGRRALVQVLILESTTAVRLEPSPDEVSSVSFTLRNDSDRVIEGLGRPQGGFDGELVHLGEFPRWVPRSLGYCGTGYFPEPPLAPGGERESAPSPWVIGDFDIRTALPGSYLWIVPITAAGWTERVAEHRDGTVDASVVRTRAAIASLEVP